MAGTTGRLFKGIVGFELLAVAGAYGLFHGLNSSPSFRVRCSEWAPFVVGGFYQIADSINPRMLQSEFRTQVGACFRFSDVDVANHLVAAACKSVDGTNSEHHSPTAPHLDAGARAVELHVRSKRKEHEPEEGLSISTWPQTSADAEPGGKGTVEDYVRKIRQKYMKPKTMAEQKTWGEGDGCGSPSQASSLMNLVEAASVMAKRSTQMQSRTQGGRARVPQRAPPRSVCTTASPAATAVSAAAGQDKRVLTPISSSSSTIRRVKRVASLVVAPGQRTKCQDAAVLGSHARQKGSAGAADRKHGSAPGGDDKREQGRGGKGKYDKEYFKTRTSSYASVFGRGDSWVASVKLRDGSSKQLYFADETDAAAAVDCFCRARGEKCPNFAGANPRHVLTAEEVEAKRIRHGQRFQSKSKAKINYTFTPSSAYKGVSLLHGAWTARIIQRGRCISLGSFRSEEEAARAWDRKAIEFGRPQQALNFPDN